jgi:hypothetical protein
MVHSTSQRTKLPTTFPEVHYDYFEIQIMKTKSVKVGNIKFQLNLQGVYALMGNFHLRAFVYLAFYKIRIPQELLVEVSHIECQQNQ